MRWHGSYRQWALALGLAFAVGLNVQLVRQVNRLASANDEMRKEMEEVEQGSRLPALRGTDPNGTALNIDYTEAGRYTVLMVFTRTCPYCLENWPSWARLQAKVNPAAARLVAIDLSPTPDPDYYRVHGLTNLPLFTSVEYRAGRAYRLDRVPATMLIDGKGTVVRTWIGPLDQSALSVLERAVSTAPAMAMRGLEPVLATQ